MSSAKRNVSTLFVCGLAIAAASAQTPAALTAADKSAIEGLVASYARALAQCRAEEYAELFVPDTGYFASGFRGRMVGRDELIALVESERHCLAPAANTAAQRPGGAAPAVAIEPTPGGARGLVSLGAAEYQDEYARTPEGWRFVSRTVILAAEKAAGLDDADDFVAIERLSGAALGDFYEAGENGARGRLLTSGVRVGVANNEVTGRAFLKDGGYYDDVYEKLPSGEWRVKSRTHVPDGAP